MSVYEYYTRFLSFFQDIIYIVILLFTAGLVCAFAQKPRKLGPKTKTVPQGYGNGA